MAGQHPPLVQKFLDKVSRSRDFSISLVVHVILVTIFGTMILFEVVKEQPDFRSEGPLVSAREEVARPKDQTQQLPNNTLDFQELAKASSQNILTPQITVNNANISEFRVAVPTVDKSPSMVAPPAPAPRSDVADKISPQDAMAIKSFADTWVLRSNGSRKPEYEFTAYIGQYQGGNWNSTVRMSKGKIETGSLSNLLYLMSHWSDDRVRTNYRNVEAIRLDSDEIFAVKPPFIFLTGTRDFALTDKEVENLRKYLRLGGCVWGDGSVPGQRSGFDIAFKREMRRVVGGDQDFADLPENHALFSQPYFKEVRSVPAGLNSYQLPVKALKMYGEVAVIYTANDYGDMWQIGLDSKGEIDLSRNASGQLIAVNDSLYAMRDVYIRNISPEALETSFKFGTNVVMHLLTRWQSRLANTPAL